MMQDTALGEATMVTHIKVRPADPSKPVRYYRVANDEATGEAVNVLISEAEYYAEGGE
jgi:hypothetical protein